MKFLCDNCKAKYQIPDEKIAGRTLRMKCRKCDHEIVLKGPKDEASTEGSNATKKRPGSSSGPAPRPGARRGGSHAGPRPAPAKRPGSALGSDFRKGSLAPEAPSAKAPAAEWYVAINDVPVGPIKRDEVARKIGLGAVTGESLCWREGFDDWRPVAQVAELSSLLQQRRVPPPPGSTSTPPPARPSVPPNNVVPIGGRLGAAAAPAFDESELEDERTVMAPAPMAEPEPVRRPAAAPKPVVAPKPVAKPKPAPKPTPKPVAVPAPAPAPEPPPDEDDDPFALPAAAAMVPAPAPAPTFSAPPAAAATPARRGIPVGAWIAIVGAGAFGITLALAIVPKLFDDTPEPVAAMEPTPEPTPEVTPEPELELEVPEPETPPTAETEVPEAETPTETSTMRSTSTMRAVATGGTPTAMTDNLTDEQRRQLELLTMSSTSGATPGMIALGGSTSGNTAREDLDNDAVRRVVTAQSNQLALRRCYEVAIRGMPEAPAVRLDVEVVVGASGTVTRATARGDSVGQLSSCVEQTVRRWRFPPSSNGGRAQFPVVFSGGGR
ncbi:MAG: zinc-ribbon domain-containing protein [Sandaracinus sp.]|nr:zinc-ribbon domain-containing protein [Sandaracinus sp.]